MTRIALATAAHYPDLSPDDQVLHSAMKQRGLAAEPVVWDSNVDWSTYDAVVIRSIWDYHLKYDRFLDWLVLLEQADVPVHNSTGVLRWNADKRYLNDLADKGVRITPTRVVARAAGMTLTRVLADTGWRHAVVKPVVSSTGYETWIVTTPISDQDEERFTRQSAAMAVLVQEFAEEVADGEYSFVFIAGTYSHSILKRAAPDEFRVHIEHGGTVESFAASASDIAWAQSVVHTLEQPWTYARVDAVRAPDGLKLMEFELLDPELFFAYQPSATGPLIDAILRHAR